MEQKINTNKTQSLSDREKQILKLIAEGLLAKQVADHLSLSPNTIETVKKNICRKLQAKNTAHAVKIAMEKGYII